MTLIIRALFLALLFFSYPNNIAICGTAPYSGPDDPGAVMAAEEAVGRLGRDRGAVSINYKTVDIVGLAVAISGKSVMLEKTLKNLNAKKVGTEIRISLSGDVLFDFDKWDIRLEADEDLGKISQVVKKLKKSNMLIEGYTDSKGSESYNLKLSQKRADSVKKWFLEKGGLSQLKFVTRGYGELKPVAANTKPDGSDDPQGRAQNRRVEIKLK